MNPGGARSSPRPAVAGLPARRLEFKPLPLRLLAAGAVGGLAALAWVAWALLAFAASQ